MFVMKIRTTAVLALALGACTGGKGPKGDPGSGAPGAPAIAQIEPASGVLDRELDVAIAGNETSFDAGTTVAFGAGVTVTQITATTSAALVAHVRIDKAAAIGPRDVTIATSDGTKLTATAAFAVTPAIDVAIRAGQPQQGGIVIADLHDNDPTNFFDGGLFAQGRAFRIGGNALSSTFLDLGPIDATTYLVIDPNAPAAGQLVAENLDPLDGLTPLTTFRSDPKQLPIAAATSTPLAATTTAPLDQPLQTQFYNMTTSGPAIVSLQVFGISTVLSTWTYPASGASADLLTQFLDSTALPTATATTFYVVIAAAAPVTTARLAPSTTGPSAIAAPTFTPATLNDEISTAHGTVGSAQTVVPANLSAPIVVRGTLSAPGEFDLYALGALGATGSTVTLTLTTNADIEAFVTDTQPNGLSFGVAPLPPQHNQSTTFPGNASANVFLLVRARPNAATPTGAYTIGLMAK
jgi:hypothetical protein